MSENLVDVVEKEDDRDSPKEQRLRYNNSSRVARRGPERSGFRTEIIRKSVKAGPR